ncbi:MAG: hypothetical protein ACK4HV_01610 [Parachlamydiaceae bacterium]
MTRLDNANDKIQMICEQIKSQAINPALVEAEQILDKAKKEAEEIKSKAFKEIEEEKLKAFNIIEKEKLISQNAINLAVKQAIEKLKSDIINLFGDQLLNRVESKMSHPDIACKLIDCVCETIQKEGLHSPLHLTIGNKINIQELINALSIELKAKLEKGPIEIGSFTGGAKIKLQDKNLTIDVSDNALKELFSAFLKRPDLRALIFKD